MVVSKSFGLGDPSVRPDSQITRIGQHKQFKKTKEYRPKEKKGPLLYSCLSDKFGGKISQGEIRKDNLAGSLPSNSCHSCRIDSLTGRGFDRRM